MEQHAELAEVASGTTLVSDDIEKHVDIKIHERPTTLGSLESNDTATNRSDAEGSEQISQMQETQTMDPQENLLDSPAAKACIQNNYPKKDVGNAIQVYFQTHDHRRNFIAEDLFHILEATNSDTWKNNGHYCRIGDGQSENEKDVAESETNAKNMSGRIVFHPCGHSIGCPRCGL